MKDIGEYGESVAAQYLKRRGFLLLEKNWRFGRSGELDIIAQKETVVHFVEVKSRQSSFTGFSGIESVDVRKQQKIIWLAEQYFIRNEERLVAAGILGSSFDIIIVTLNPRAWFKKSSLLYLPDAFSQ